MEGEIQSYQAISSQYVDVAGSCPVSRDGMKYFLIKIIFFTAVQLLSYDNYGQTKLTRWSGLVCRCHWNLELIISCGSPQGPGRRAGGDSLRSQHTANIESSDHPPIPTTQHNQPNVTKPKSRETRREKQLFLQLR